MLSAYSLVLQGPLSHLQVWVMKVGGLVWLSLMPLVMPGLWQGSPALLGMLAQRQGVSLVTLESVNTAAALCSELTALGLANSRAFKTDDSDEKTHRACTMQ